MKRKRLFVGDPAPLVTVLRRPGVLLSSISEPEPGPVIPEPQEPPLIVEPLVPPPAEPIKPVWPLPKFPPDPQPQTSPLEEPGPAPEVELARFG